MRQASQENGSRRAAISRHTRKRRIRERRAEKRQPVHDISEICFTGKRQPVTCMVLNLNGLGALIEAATSELPSRFILANHARHMRAVCQVVWSNGAQFGVRFLTTPKPMT